MLEPGYKLYREIYTIARTLRKRNEKKQHISVIYSLSCRALELKTFSTEPKECKLLNGYLALMIDPPYYTQSREINIQDAVLVMFFT